MRFILLASLVYIVICPAQAQLWLKNLPDKPLPELTLFDYQNAFETYWSPYQVDNGYYYINDQKIKAPGWKTFRRWEYMMERKVDPVTGQFPQQSAAEVIHQYYSNHGLPRTTAQSDWKSLGPTSSGGGYEGIGRINCTAVHPIDLSTYWIGSASGGLWQTTDDGSTWTCLTDQNEVMAVSDIIVTKDYDESHTLYIATGDRDFFDNFSVGVLKSTDSGDTWQKTGLSYTINQWKAINRLLIDPSNATILYAATTDGVYKTIDGGTTWDDQLTDQVFIDMEFNPANSQIIYGGTREGEVYVSENSGLSWTRSLFDFAGYRTELAVSPDQPSWVYAVTESGGLEGIYKSTDHAITFEKIFDGLEKNLLSWDINGSGTSGQGAYDLCIAASPTDANIVLLGGVNTWRSTDGGLSWSIVNQFAGQQGQPVHADQHHLLFRQNGEVLEGNDGGIYFSSDNGTTWTDKTNGMAISQIYKLGVSATNQDEIITGLQDNGSKLHFASGWQHVTGGDGMECMIDHTDVKVQYASTQYGSLFRTLNHWTSSLYVKPQNAGEGNWVTPYVMDPVDANVLYGGFREIWKSSDKGTSWTQISNINASDKIRSMAIAPSDPKVIYVAESSRMWKTTTGEGPFEKISGNEPGNSNSITSITVKHDDPQTVWVTAGSFIHPAVFQSFNGGASWTNITEGIPPFPIYTIVENKQAVGGTELFVGTEAGVYFKKGDDPWIPFNTGLPNVIVNELEFYYDSDPSQTRLRAATYGRGLWETRIEFISSPMVYTSGTTKQISIEPVKPGKPDQEILRVEIYASGDLEPLDIQSFTFNTEGSTNPASDISGAKLYYTGSVNAFLKDNLFGEPKPNPAGSFTINGHQTLQSGVNYFWLSFDIKEEAVLGNQIDAQCTSFNINEELVPAVTNPDGFRLIALTYCDAGTDHLGSEYISRVKMGNVDRNSQKGEGGYQDWTEDILNVEINKSQAIAVTNFSPHNWDELRIWADWNTNGEFDLPGEEVYSSGILGITTYNASIIPPANAKTGITRMRIRLQDAGFGPNNTPCGDSYLGEVEDYSLYVNEEIMTNTQDFELSSLLIYPNPVSNELILQLPGNDNSVQFEIIDCLGKQIFHNELADKIKINIRNWHSGIYFVRIKTKNGNILRHFVKVG